LLQIYVLITSALHILSCFIVYQNEVRVGLSNVKKHSCKQDHQQNFDTQSSCRFPHFCLMFPSCQAACQFGM